MRYSRMLTRSDKHTYLSFEAQTPLTLSQGKLIQRLGRGTLLPKVLLFDPKVTRRSMPGRPRLFPVDAATPRASLALRCTFSAARSRGCRRPTLPRRSSSLRRHPSAAHPISGSPQRFGARQRDSGLAARLLVATQPAATRLGGATALARGSSPLVAG